MIFLTDTDFDVQVQTEILNLISSTASQDIAERMAIDQIKAYISGKYDTATIFAQTADARNHFIIMIIIDIMLYHLWAKKAPRAIPEYRETRYNDALEWLNAVGKGTMQTDLPQLPSEEYLSEVRIYSQYTPNNNKF